MKKRLIVVLLLMSIYNTLHAQDSSYAGETRKMKDKTYATFNMNQFEIKHRHTVYLQKGNKMIIELSRLSDYEGLKDIGSILTRFRNDIAFYRDSIAPDYAGNVRIDYTVSTGSDYHKMRFKKYDANGDMYVANKGALSKLKLDQDTISFKFFSGDDQQSWDWGVERYTSMRVTFLLNNYTDIDELIEHKDTIQHYIDTMATASQALLKEHYEKRHDIYLKTTIVYRPYWVIPERLVNAFNGKTPNFRFILYDYDAANSTFYGSPLAFFTEYHSGPNVNINIGAGLVKNKIAPTFDLGPEYRQYWEKGKSTYSVFGAYVSPYFLFEKGGDGRYKTYIDWFINGEIGIAEPSSILGISYKRFTIGAGYLINPDGLYFQRTTFKVFANFSFIKGITVAPEMMSTNNFHNFFPGLTLKVI